MKVQSIEDLFLDELKDLYSAEKQITKALPKLVKAASTQELSAAFDAHLQETKGQVERLEEIFEKLGKKGTGKTCEGMKGVLAEGAEVIEEIEKGVIRDAGLISAAQRVEHYEIAGYGSVIAFAQLLGKKDIVELLEETLEEEKATDEKLTEISQTVNQEAQSAAA
jgi:ferritin-like metal-binding protein YciE